MHPRHRLGSLLTSTGDRRLRLDAGFCCSCRKNTDYVLGGSSPAPWLVGRPTQPHDWTAPAWDQTLAEYLEWSYDQGTTQDMASKTLAAVRWAFPNRPRPMSRSFPSAIACLQGWKRLELGSARSAGAAGGALACRTLSKTPGSLLLPALRDVHATIGRTGAARLPSSFRQSEEFLEPRAGGRFSSERVFHMLIFVLAVVTGLLFVHCGQPSCRSLQCRSAHRVCTFNGLPHLHWRNSRQN